MQGGKGGKEKIGDKETGENTVLVELLDQGGDEEGKRKAHEEDQAHVFVDPGLHVLLGGRLGVESGEDACGEGGRAAGRGGIGGGETSFGETIAESDDMQVELSDVFCLPLSDFMSPSSLAIPPPRPLPPS